MSIQKVATKSFELEVKVYFKILIRSRLKDHWWFYAVLFLIVMWNINDFGEQSFATSMVVVGLIYPVFSFFYLYFWATSAKNKAVFLQRKMEFDDAYITIDVEDGTQSKTPFSRIVQFVETRTFMLLYLSKSQFIYIPKNSFAKTSDLNVFQSRINAALESPVE